MTLQFLRNKVIEVEPRPDGDLSVSWRLTDDLLKAEIQLIVQPPELEIIEAEARLERYPPLSCRDASNLIKKVEGVSIGSGLRKILAGLLGGTVGCSILMDAVLESSNAVILHFTRPGIEAGETVADPDKKLAALRERLKTNPRLVRSCIAFQDESPIMAGLNL
ncbi:MAG: hypothetical protein A2Y79_01765 [Deltaproteobacteria bacterium RBG_13_43_22]|jgi:hypothetical protein|nr:MAG: hypothetical protein A2Y79_01765 [Deltaproteobacteria bacterium RBG_13_43_22]